MTMPLVERTRRPKRPGRRASAREVCLLGGERAGDWRPGDRLRCAGRSYRVASAREPDPRDSRRYVHLSAVDA